MNSFNIWVTFLVLFFPIQHLNCEVRKTIKLEKYYQCQDRNPSKYVFDLRNLGASVFRTILYLHGNFTIKEEVFDPVKLVIYASRCSLTQPKECESFTKRTIGNLCDILVTPSLRGYRYLSKFRPHLSCPLKPGVVDVSDADLILNGILLLPLEGYQWTLKGMFLGKKAKRGKVQGIGCITVIFTVQKVVGRAEKDPFDLLL